MANQKNFSYCCLKIGKPPNIDLLNPPPLFFYTANESFDKNSNIFHRKSNMHTFYKEKCLIISLLNKNIFNSTLFLETINKNEIEKNSSHIISSGSSHSILIILFIFGCLLLLFTYLVFICIYVKAKLGLKKHLMNNNTNDYITTGNNHRKSITPPLCLQGISTGTFTNNSNSFSSILSLDNAINSKPIRTSESLLLTVDLTQQQKHYYESIQDVSSQNYFNITDLDQKISMPPVPPPPFLNIISKKQVESLRRPNRSYHEFLPRSNVTNESYVDLNQQYSLKKSIFV